MHIGVMVSNWEQECCGSPFRVGDDVQWDLTWSQEWIRRTLGPEAAENVDYAETHHGGDDSPRTSVTGNVISIRAVDQRVHRSDPAGPWTSVDGECTTTPVEVVPGRGQTSIAEPWPLREGGGDEGNAPRPTSPDDSEVDVPGRGWYPLSAFRPLEEDDSMGGSVSDGWIVVLEVDDNAQLPHPIRD